MFKRRFQVACLAVFSAALGWVFACTTDNSTGSTSDAGAGMGGSSSGAGQGGSSSGSGSGGSNEGGDSMTAADAGNGLLVDDMTEFDASMPPPISMPPPGMGETPGGYYTYSDDPASNYLGMRGATTGTSNLGDTPVSPSVPEPDGTTISGAVCFGAGSLGAEAGMVVGYAGLGMNLVIGSPPYSLQDTVCSGSPPFAFDASKYSGVSFYIYVDSSAGPDPNIRFNMPDTQTGDHCAKPTPACVAADGGTGDCYDDFGADVSFTSGTWTKVMYKWSDLAQESWGAQYTAFKNDQILGMKWQVNGGGVDAALDSFRFCISNIYFTP